MKKYFSLTGLIIASPALWYLWFGISNDLGNIESCNRTNSQYPYTLSEFHQSCQGYLSLVLGALLPLAFSFIFYIFTWYVEKFAGSKKSLGLVISWILFFIAFGFDLLVYGLSHAIY